MIRRAGPADADTIAELYERSFRTLTFLPVLHTPEEHRFWFGKQLPCRGTFWPRKRITCGLPKLVIA